MLSAGPSRCHSRHAMCVVEEKSPEETDGTMLFTVLQNCCTFDCYNCSLVVVHATINDVKVTLCFLNISKDNDTDASTL